jgi:hypothetical protein
MGATLTANYPTHHLHRSLLTRITRDQVDTLAKRWKKLGSPLFLTPNEFQKALVQGDDLKLNYDKFYQTGSEIDVCDFLTQLLILSRGAVSEKLASKASTGSLRLLPVRPDRQSDL